MAFGILLRRQGFECTQLGHIAKTTTEETTATCKTPGSYSWVCNFCGKSGSQESVTNPSNHENEKVIVGEDNCCYMWPCCDKEESTHTEVYGGTAEAHTKCEICNYIILGSDKHNFSLIEEVLPSCTEKGYTKEKCECGYVKTTDIDPTGHAPSREGPACTYDEICTTCGEVITHKTGHIDTNLRDGYCDLCGTKVECVTHEYEIIPGKAPSCEESGYESYRQCKYCGTLENEIVYIDPTGHTFKTYNGYDFTSVSNTEYAHERECETCGFIQSGTCTNMYEWNPLASGEVYMHYPKCTGCGAIYPQDEERCTGYSSAGNISVGYTHTLQCFVCDRWVSAEPCSPEGEWSYTQNGNGTHSFKCKNCGQTCTEYCSYSSGLGSCVCGNICDHSGEKSYGSCVPGLTHVVYCEICGILIYEENCDLDFTFIDDTTHNVSCSTCNWNINEGHNYVKREGDVEGSGCWYDCFCGSSIWWSCYEGRHSYRDKSFSPYEGHVKVCVDCGIQYQCGSVSYHEDCGWYECSNCDTTSLETF